MIVDREDGQSRILMVDDSGITESPSASLASVAGEVVEQQPDLILVHPGALALAGENLVSELNRLARFYPGYAWTPAPGELASS